MDNFTTDLCLCKYTIYYVLVRVLSAFIKSFIFTVEPSMKLAENMYFGIIIVISNGATKKMMQGGLNRPN